ncbi:lymphotoxin-alpha [Cheilinus undulatus]|uniref:lymphotoxin-alpha n=1 Tax=Cheilinus undulatus TaxID=241271 RepID=UPI001BD37CC0|nr:lymphotoxin-alpha [Cheilinus undulatus]
MDGSELLSCDSLTSGMEADYSQNTLVHLLRQEQQRSTRGFRFLSLVLLLVLAVLTLLTAAMLRGRAHPADSQEMMQSYSHSSGITDKQQQPDYFETPSAMLTAPEGNTNDGVYLKWESRRGHAYCRGGFNYSSGSLVVPRSGVYRVFLQITFESRNVECPRDGVLRLINIVQLSRDNYPKNLSLLSSVDTVVCSLESWSKSVYTAGLFSLEANWKLLVKSSQPELIARSEDQVFFGAELVSVKMT